MAGIALALAVPALAHAADAPLSLADAIATAMAHAQPVRAAEETANAAAAGAMEARSWRQPHVELSETYTRTTNPVYVFMNLLGQENFGPANFDPAFLNRPPAMNNFNTKVAVSQALFAGGKIAAGSAAGRYGAEAARADAARTRQAVTHRVIEAYSGAVLAASYRSVAEEALRTAQAHVKLVSDLRATGMVVESDLLQARVHQGEAEEQLITAEAGLATARGALNVAMGRAVDAPLTLPDAIEPPATPLPPLDELTRGALTDRKDLEAMDRRVRAAGQMAKVARAGFLPEVGITGQYEANAENAPGSDGHNWSVFVGAKLALWDGRATAARLTRARAEEAAAAQMHDMMRQGATLEVLDAWHKVRAAEQRLAIAASAVEQSRAALSIIEDRYREGMTTVVELMGAQTALSAARTRDISARRDVLLGRATLDLAAGRL